MRVLHVIPSVSSTDGGPSRALASMEQALSGAGLSITTITTDDNGYGQRLSALSRPETINGACRVYKRKLSDAYKLTPSMIPWLAHNIREFDVVHIHALFSFPSVSAALMAIQKNVPYIIRPLGTLTRYGMTQRRPLAKRISLAILEGPILRRASAVHFTSEAEFLEAQALGIQMCDVVIPLGIDTEVIERPKHQLIPHDRTVLLYLSRLDPKKNLEGLLKGFASTDPMKRNLVLVIAGGGDASYAQSLRSLARHLGIAKEVIWLGHLEHEDKAAALASADIFVLPSFSENFGIAAVEALSAGIPCVLGRGVAIAAEVEAFGAGFGVAPYPEDIASAVSYLADDADLRQRMGKAAKKLAIESFSSAAMSKKLINLYKDVTKSATPKAGSPRVFGKEVVPTV